MKFLKSIKIAFFENGLFVDIPTVAIFLYMNFKNKWAFNLLNGRDDVKDITNTFIATCTSISGFSLAALTIIISIRSNVMSRKDIKPENALEMLFQSEGYFKITKIFKHIILEQTCGTIVLFFTWLYFKYNSDIHFSALCVCSFLLVVTVLRLFYILFFVIESEKFKKPKRPDIPQQNY